MLLITMAGSTDAQVGEVRGETTRAVGCAKGGEGHDVLWVQWGREWWRELDVSQIRQRATGVVCSREHGWVQLLVW